METALGSLLAGRQVVLPRSVQADSLGCCQRGWVWCCRAPRWNFRQFQGAQTLSRAQPGERGVRKFRQPFLGAGTACYSGGDVQGQESKLAGAGGKQVPGRQGGWQGRCGGTRCPWAPCSGQGDSTGSAENKINSVRWFVLAPHSSVHPK